MKTTVTKSFMALLAAAMTVFFVGCGPDEPDNPTPPTPTTIAVTGVSLNKTSMTLTEGGSEALTATVAPSNASNTGVSWSSSNTGVATVNGGQVTAVKAGTATITVTTSDGGKTATCSITVEAKKIAVTGVKINPATLELIVGETGTVTATVEPADATNKAVNWTTSDKSVATVDGGKITAVAPGTATIIATTADGGKAVTCKVTVSPKPVPVEGVSVEVVDSELAEGETTKLKVTITPANATSKAVTFSSSDESVATVDEEGNITAVGTGTATITVKTADGKKTTSVKITVTPKVIHVEGIAFTKDNVTLVEGEKVLLYVSFTPKNPSDKRVTWSSSNSSVATVDTKGNVTGVKAGTAKITVKTTDGGKTATCTVTVKAATVSVTGVTLNKSSLSLTEGGSATLTATVQPSNATNKSVTWSSSKTSVATVNSSGKVTAVKAGTATITVKTADGSKTATCTVTVKTATVSVTGVILNKSSLSLTEGGSATLTATVQPTNATNKDVSWKSSNTSVATVDNNGKVTAKAAGSATITVTTNDGSKTATCAVTVAAATIPVTSVTLNPTSLTLTVGETYLIGATCQPSNATIQTWSWASTNTSVATVSSSGKVTAVKAGNATITLGVYPGGKFASCVVTVKNPDVHVTGISVGATLPLGIYDGGPNQTTTMSYTITPSNATNKAVTWSSSNNSIATVNSQGLITGKSAGRATITVKTVDGGYTASRDVIVTHFIPVSSIVIDPSSFSMYVNQTVGIDYTLNPSNATIRNLDWKSSDPTVVSIVQNEVSSPSNPPYVKALKKGTVTMTASARDGSGKKATCTITVK